MIKVLRGAKNKVLHKHVEQHKTGRKCFINKSVFKTQLN